MLIVTVLGFPNEPPHDKTNKMTVFCPVWSESSLTTWRKLGSLATHWVQSKDWSDWADAQADLSLHWAHSYFVGFVMRWLKWSRMKMFKTTSLIICYRSWHDQVIKPLPNRDFAFGYWKIQTHPKNCYDYSQIWTVLFYHRAICPKNADRI